MSQQNKNKNATTSKNEYWRDPKPAYTMIGTGQTTKMFPSGTIDTLSVIGSLNESQLKIFLYFRDMIKINNQLESKYPDSRRNLNEVSLILDDSYTKMIKSLMQRNNNVKTLVDKNILKKGKKKSYMINPFLLIPNREFKRHLGLWQYYQSIDVAKGKTLDNLLVYFELTLDESIKNMDVINL
ncbi:hypothetical protein L3081_03355 [Colwellia sp. MSW7]|uniref:Uncharacterized protein n=1 Tax=Colwellia maritima TaxID=2912588 RepID=A0ABS9WXR6_9GAMM|nr:hypothetical protein [Colwellia maritima]MCI2282615.1 hypothetical protein [Colwellia maritima]